ncbi:hypothetical protein [Chengkuizengella sediminis]|uniref:hypothetical protein n=1 Tax=Chengkuizengella sediminis TaxID=1885917 RepID=UPI00138A437A|nr:hypothetical protein [Chengkuizengella sediminis]NDI35884.1 hypothetical protein [Chengkuizengella sediminis]
MSYDKKKITKISLLILTILALTSCNSPNPNEKQEIEMDEPEKVPVIENTTMIAIQKNI